MSVFLCPHLMGIWVNCIVVEWKLISTGYCMIFAKILSATFILCQHFTVVLCLSSCGGWGDCDHLQTLYSDHIQALYIDHMHALYSDHIQTSPDLHGLALHDFRSNTVVFEVSELNFVDKTKYYANGVRRERTRLQLIEFCTP